MAAASRQAGAASRRWRALQAVLRLPPRVARAARRLAGAAPQGESRDFGLRDAIPVWTSRTLGRLRSTGGEVTTGQNGEAPVAQCRLQRRC